MNEYCISCGAPVTLWPTRLYCSVCEAIKDGYTVDLYGEPDEKEYAHFEG
ncbi:hypothetical protein [Bacillus massiliglaciei]|nr:hypothetical protein [Bacillus massiliglaciei]